MSTDIVPYSAPVLDMLPLRQAQLKAELDAKEHLRRQQRIADGYRKGRATIKSK